MNPLEMLMQMVGGAAGGEPATPAQARDFIESDRLRPGRVTGVPNREQAGEVPPMGIPPQMDMGPPVEGGGLDPEMIRLLMMGSQA